MSYTRHVYQKSPIAKRNYIEKLKKNNESPIIANETHISSESSTPKKWKKSKVKNLVSMFNSKITQFVNRDMNFEKTNTLRNKFSAEPNAAVKSPTLTKEAVSQSKNSQLKEETSIPSPRSTVLANVQPKPPACFAAEEIFARLSVKEKASFYMQFIEEMSKNNPQFPKNIHEIVVKEQQCSGKELLNELELKQKSQSAALQRMYSMKVPSSAANSAAAYSPKIKAKEFEDIGLKSLTFADKNTVRNSIFENEQIDDMFFSWFKENHGNTSSDTMDGDNQSEIDEANQRSDIDDLLEEAIAKLECVEVEKNVEENNNKLNDLDSRRNSLNQPVMKEDLLFRSPKPKQTESKSNAKAPTKENNEKATKLAEEETSEFWLECGDFSITWDIMYTEADRLRLLHEIFTQVSCETKDLHFGIDDQKFSVHYTAEELHNLKLPPPSRDSSQYWFATGDLTIPFSGKYLATNKIQRIFRLIKETIEETGTLRFGVDCVEFSNVAGFWNQAPKFSVESQYEILVGLQSGNSNGLEGRSKYAWPHQPSVSDFYQTDNENEYHSIAASLDNFGNTYRSRAMMNHESYYEKCDNEQFERTYSHIPVIDNVIQSDKQHLNSAKKQPSSTGRISLIPKDALDHLKGTSEYMEKLKGIVADISNIDSGNKFKECTLDELESYMYYMKCYTEICLSKCGRHMDTVMDALTESTAF